jgi:hypothetical protein
MLSPNSAIDKVTLAIPSGQYRRSAMKLVSIACGYFSLQPLDRLHRIVLSGNRKSKFRSNLQGGTGG